MLFQLFQQFGPEVGAEYEQHFGLNKSKDKQIAHKGWQKVQDHKQDQQRNVFIPSGLALGHAQPLIENTGVHRYAQGLA